MIQYTIKHLPAFDSVTDVIVQCTAQENEYCSKMQHIFANKDVYTEYYWEMVIYMLRYITNQIAVLKTRK